MPNHFRRFEVGPDPYGRIWRVQFLWLQNGISIRHTDTVDVKFRVSAGGEWQEKVIALRHPDLLAVSRALARPLTDPWCLKLAALHLRHMIETGEDVEKTIVTLTLSDLRKRSETLERGREAA